MEPNFDTLHVPMNTVNANSSLGFFNTSYKLATRFLGLPSRVLARMRRLDEILEHHPPNHQEYVSPSFTSLPNGYATAAPNPSDSRIHRMRQGLSGGQGVASVPGPWGFLTSGYFLGIFIMVSSIPQIDLAMVEFG